MSTQQMTADAAIRIIEEAFPVVAFGDDAGSRIDAIHQTAADPAAFRADFGAALPALLLQVNGDISELAKLLKVTEPFCHAWPTTQELLIQKGWVQ
jgi:hypothetical protein